MSAVPYPLAPVFFLEPQQLNEAPAHPSPAGQTSDNLLALPQRDGKRLVLALSRRARIERDQTSDDLPPCQALNTLDLQAQNRSTIISSVPR
jgi:hypothetical protein